MLLYKKKNNFKVKGEETLAATIPFLPTVCFFSICFKLSTIVGGGFRIEKGYLLTTGFGTDENTIVMKSKNLESSGNISIDNPLASHSVVYKNNKSEEVIENNMGNVTKNVQAMANSLEPSLFVKKKEAYISLQLEILNLMDLPTDLLD